MEFNLSTFLILILLALPIASAETTVTAGSDFQISIPSGWVEIPSDVIDQYEVAIYEATGQEQTFEYGYQSASAANWFEYPYALVQVRRTGRIPEGQLKNYQKVEREMKEGIDEAEESFSSLLENMTMGETVYEQDRHMLWSAMTMDVANIGKVKGLIVVKLTEFGVVQFMGYGRVENFSQHETTYRKMISSITVNESDIYRPRFTDNAPTIFGINLGQTLIAGITGAAIGGVFMLFSLVTRKKSVKTNNPAP